MITLAGWGAVTPLGAFTARSPDLVPLDLVPSAALEVRDFALGNFPVAPKTFLDRASALMLAAVGLALEDAGLAGPLGARAGLCLGTRFGCVETMAAFESSLAERGSRGASPLAFSHSFFNAPAALVSIEWSVSGYHLPLVGPDSGLWALEEALSALRADRADIMLCGAVEALGAQRRAWGEATGIAPGEAAFALVLRRDSAPRSGAVRVEDAAAILDAIGPDGAASPGEFGAVEPFYRRLLARLAP